MHLLGPSPVHYPYRVTEVYADVERLSETLVRFSYVVTGDLGAIVLPLPAPPLRTNGLWKTTCFEAFLKPVGAEAYREFNFSPSGQWAAYEFDSYRQGMVEAWMPATPEIVVKRQDDRLELAVAVSLNLPEEPYRLGLSAVIEEQGVWLSYWAANHPSGQPDFHHHSCFDLELAPAPAP